MGQKHREYIKKRRNKGNWENTRKGFDPNLGGLFGGVCFVVGGGGRVEWGKITLPF